jgi:hypothetical protein
MVVELSWFQVEDVENPHSGPTTASTTNSTFNYVRDIVGLNAQQVAEICGCSLATAKIRIHRARHRLKPALQQQCEFYRDRENVFRCERKA